MQRFWKTLKQIVSLTLTLAALMLLIPRSNAAASSEHELLRGFTRRYEFDLLAWTLNAWWIKAGDAALGASDYLNDADQKALVLEYLDVVAQSATLRWEINTIYANPQVSAPRLAAAEKETELERLLARKKALQPLAEAILQRQVAHILDEIDLDSAGQPFPPVAFHVTLPPAGLIISPRDRIEQMDNISISPDLDIQEIETLEENVDRARNVSSLVVGIGGIGLYPTMVMETTSLNWLCEVVSHEWIHNFLTLRPLGMRYTVSPEMRIINETTASIAGKEIGLAVIQRFYPEFAPPPPQPVIATPSPLPSSAAPEPPAFDFNAEMRLTRVTVDKLLAEGEIEKAESYMEERRQFLWDNGYRIRKLNQAYFAFYGAYADEPGGAAGEDPVSAAVRALRSQSASLTDFLQRIARVNSYQALQQLVAPQTLP